MNHEQALETIRRAAASTTLAKTVFVDEIYEAYKLVPQTSITKEDVANVYTEIDQVFGPYKERTREQIKTAPFGVEVVCNTFAQLDFAREVARQMGRLDLEFKKA